MLKVPVVWVRYSGPGNPCYTKVEGAQFFIIGEEGENVLAVMKGERLFIPIFESAGLEESKATEGILERMLAVAECCLLETGEVGTVYGVFRSSYQILGDKTSYVKEVGLACTASEFNPAEEVDRFVGVAAEYKPSNRSMDETECAQLGLPTMVEIDTERGQPG